MTGYVWVQGCERNLEKGRAKPSMHREMLEEFVKVVSADFDHARVKVTLLRLGSTLQGGLFERDSEATA